MFAALPVWLIPAIQLVMYRQALDIIIRSSAVGGVFHLDGSAIPQSLWEAGCIMFDDPRGEL